MNRCAHTLPHPRGPVPAHTCRRYSMVRLHSLPPSPSSPAHPVRTLHILYNKWTLRLQKGLFLLKKLNDSSSIKKCIHFLYSVWLFLGLMKVLIKIKTWIRYINDLTQTLVRNQGKFTERNRAWYSRTKKIIIFSDYPTWGLKPIFLLFRLLGMEVAKDFELESCERKEKYEKYGMFPKGVLFHLPLFDYTLCRDVSRV